jgi:hypothetical protein
MNTPVKLGLLAAISVGGYLLFRKVNTPAQPTAAGTIPTTNVNNLALGTAKFNLAQPTQTDGFTASLLMLQNGNYLNGVPLLPTSSAGYTAADALYGTGPGSVTEYLANGYSVVTNAAGVSTMVPGLGPTRAPVV